VLKCAPLHSAIDAIEAYRTQFIRAQRSGMQAMHARGYRLTPLSELSIFSWRSEFGVFLSFLSGWRSEKGTIFSDL